MKIVISKGDLRRDTFHCGGHGGQNVNKVETGVRYTHIPTGLTAASCVERTQGKNQEIALANLLAKIKGKYVAEREEKGQGEYEAKPDAAFGRQIRSYILHGQQRVVDHRTGVESRNPRAVLDGDIDQFLIKH